MSGADFRLHARLEADTFNVCRLQLCRCLLMNDARFPWLILVPALADLRDLHDVPSAHRLHLFDDIERASRALETATAPFKINVAALGNQVPQLHVHVIARREDDAAWPHPVWGSGAAVPYDENRAGALCAALRKALA